MKIHKETFGRTRTYIDTVELVRLKKSAIVQISMNGKEPERFFISLEDLNDKNIFKSIERANKYYWLNNNFWEKLNEGGIYTNSLLYEYYKYIVDPFKAIELKNFDDKKLIFVDIDSHFIYILKDKNPISTIYNMSLNSESFDIDKAEKILKKNKCVWNIERDIDAYDESETLNFRFKLSQSKLNKLCEYFRDIRKEKNWQGRVRDVIIFKNWFNNKDIDTDIFKLKSTYKW